MAADQRTRAAKEALIFGLLSGYLQIADKLTENVLASYVDACAEVSVEALRMTCQRIQRGRAGLNTSYAPTPADIASRAATIDEMLKPLPKLHSGLLDMDWGRGRVDMRGLTVDEQDEIIRLGGLTADGRNFALMTLDQKREALNQKQIAAPVDLAPLQRVTDE
jgi:hypothetical protein